MHFDRLVLGDDRTCRCFFKPVASGKEGKK